MPERKKGKVDGGASPEAGADRIGALPDDALHHVLSFLPAEEAVRTCVLARRWRHLWKHATGLRIGCGGDGEDPPSVEEARELVSHLLLLRKRDSSLHTCEFRLKSPIRLDDVRYINLWIRHVVVDRDVRVLRLEIEGFWLDKPFSSQHLTTLSLSGVQLGNSSSNFSNCPNLRHLEIAATFLSSKQGISSKSLKCLTINECAVDVLTLISTPSLVSLTLDAHFFEIPALGAMPSLKEAFVKNASDECGADGCLSCLGQIPDGYGYNKNKSFLLQGLSQAENLTLMSYFNGLVFHRDLEWCPTFNNLRVLLMNEWWFNGQDFYGLKCILKHSPVLEKLTLHLFLEQNEHKVEIIGRYNQMERSATIPKHLKAIEIKCIVVDEKVLQVLKFLTTFGIYFLFK